MQEFLTLVLFPLLLILVSYYKPNICAQLDFILHSTLIANYGVCKFILLKKILFLAY